MAKTAASPAPAGPLVLVHDHGDVRRGTVASAGDDLAARLLAEGVARPATATDLATWGRAPVALKESVDVD